MLGKLLTKILANWLQHNAAEHGLLHRDQFSGIQKHCTIDAGLVLTDFISKYRERGWHTSVCAIDVAQFFPSLSHTVMERILERLGFSPVLVKLIKSYFEDRVTSYKWSDGTAPILGNTTSVWEPPKVTVSLLSFPPYTSALQSRESFLKLCPQPLLSACFMLTTVP